MQRRLNSETGVNKSFENSSCQGRIQKFFEGETSIFVSLFKRIFPEELFLSNLSAKNDSRGSRGMLLRKIFENLHTAMAILVHFEQFLRKVCPIFGPLL